MDFEKINKNVFGYGHDLTKVFTAYDVLQFDLNVPELFQDEHLHGLQLRHGDGAVGEDDEVEQGHRSRVVELGRQQEAS